MFWHGSQNTPTKSTDKIMGWSSCLKDISEPTKRWLFSVGRTHKHSSRSYRSYDSLGILQPVLFLSLCLKKICITIPFDVKFIFSVFLAKLKGISEFPVKILRNREGPNWNIAISRNFSTRKIHWFLLRNGKVKIEISRFRRFFST